jgi:hypothetical protein
LQLITGSEAKSISQVVLKITLRFETQQNVTHSVQPFVTGPGVFVAGFAILLVLAALRCD